MPKTPPSPTDPPAESLDVTRKLRILKDDYTEAVSIHDDIQETFRLSITDVLREAIHAGLPHVKKKYKDMLNSINKK